MSSWTYTELTSVRKMAPVGHASRQPACSQCLQTSDRKSHPKGFSCPPPIGPVSCVPSFRSISTNFTCRQVDAPRLPELSYECPVQARPSSGTWFHSLHATSHALQPMQTVGSVKKPTGRPSETY